MNFFQFLSHISEFSSIKSFYHIIHNWTRFEAVLKPMLQAKTISLVCQGKLMQVNQLFSQIVLTTTCSLQCPAKEIILTISFHPLSFQQHTSYISHIRQPIKCGCLVLFDCRFRNHLFSSQFQGYPENFLKHLQRKLAKVDANPSSDNSNACS